jgi:hypothetical protein|uniref:Uncharacterized protein n=1 Tax=viral metagenome TaxID=1070528 RepID=A0A6C0HDB3_9ZZZZ
MNSPQESNIGAITQNLTQTSESGLFSNKNIIIILLIILLVFSFLGINILTISGNIMQTFIQIFGPLVSQILSIFGYTTGTVLNKTADVVADTAKTGIDIAEGSIQSVGNILRDASQSNVDVRSKQSLDTVLNRGILTGNEPRADTTENPIQKPITSGKQNWCLVGEYQGKRGCIEVGEHDKCLSGQVFPNQKMCLNPTLTQT